MEKESEIYIAGHLGMVGSALYRTLENAGYNNLIVRTIRELDLTSQSAVNLFFNQEKPEYVFVAAAKVGGIMANNTYRAQFLYENLMIQNNVIHAAYLNGVKKLLFLGSSCIYPSLAPQPLKEEYLLTGELEYTNEPYAIAKIAGIKMCENYFRQYGCNFLSVMPTNLYGPNDNYNLETSHVLPALIRKIHMARCLETGNWTALCYDLDKRPIEGVTGSSPQPAILEKLSKYGLTTPLPSWGGVGG
ncbi:MAG: NAD-dependent epimerase/dehydratase family protein, partial [Bacteroidetes bacterium]|nr:NAD-dependent epimerase/dehydratase family protein [Bacteroidota bacterium]